MSKKRETPAAVARPAGRPVALRVVGAGREVPLPDGPEAAFAIGSDPANHLVLEDAFVSAFHCSLHRRADRLLVRDQRSRNGTYVNGTRVQESDVDIGARLTLGSTTLVVIGEGGRAAAKAADLLVGEDPIFRAAVQRAERASRGSGSVLVMGESGTGKELIARLVHEASSRARGPYVAVNCGAIARGLVETELFGHERGAFTGAMGRRAGLFEEAHGGTLFLDEIGELDLGLQPKLLRTLETRRLRRVGGMGEQEVDVRTVAATNRDLRQMVAQGLFRADLYHRLSGMEIRIPPLRERPDDVSALVHAFVREAAAELGPMRIEDAAVAWMKEQEWPGNVRELRNTVLQAAVMCDGGVIRKADVRAPTEANRKANEEPEPPYDGNLDMTVKYAIVRALEQHQSIRKAAMSMGMAKSSFHERMQKLRIKWPPAVIPASDP